MAVANLPCVAVALKGKLYVFSCADESAQDPGGAMHGYGNRMTAPTAERYDPARNVWEVLPPVPTARRSFAAAAVAGQLYVCGGMSLGPESRPLDIAEVYDPVRQLWRACPPMRIARGLCLGEAVENES